jgi:ABC-type Mn2+/Zn2+ transport system ATPase subunit
MRSNFISHLEIQNLKVAYGSNLVLTGVNLSLANYQLVGIIGPNGAGKSTLLKAILGMVNFRGQVLIQGLPVSQQRHLLAYVPQKNEVKWDFPVSVRDVVLMGRYRHAGWVKLLRKQDYEIADACLEMVSMQNLAKRQISQLSGGQQQRVFLARALAMQGEILLLDEPLTGIDVQSQEIVTAILLKLRDEGKLILMATHDLNATLNICDQVCCLNRQLIAVGEPHKVLNPQVLALTFGGKVISLGEDKSKTLILD